MNYILVTGGFDPIHSGHIQMFNSASKLAPTLVVGVNSDEWLIRKKNYHLMEQKERITIVKNIKPVDKVITWDDKDNSAIGAINFLLSSISSKEGIFFANGGDRNQNNIPELLAFADNKRVSFVFGVGGTNKKNSSSKIINNLKK